MTERVDFSCAGRKALVRRGRGRVGAVAYGFSTPPPHSLANAVGGLCARLARVACAGFLLLAAVPASAAEGFAFADDGLVTPRGRIAWNDVVALRLYNRPEQKHVAGVPVRANVRWGAALALCAGGGGGGI